MGAIAQHARDRLRAMMKIQDKIIDALPPQPVQHVFHERPRADRNGGLRDDSCQRVEARAKARGEHDGRKHGEIVATRN
jgi:hypothetical protein